MRRAGRRTLLLSVLCLCGPVGASQDVDDRPADRPPLAGIGRIDVVVESLPPEAVQLGVTRERLQSLSEARLRRAGVPLSPERAGGPRLRVNVTLLLLDFTFKGCVASVTVTLSAAVTLEHSGARGMADIWHAGGLAVAPTDHCAGQIQEATSHYLSQFSNDYVAANAGEPRHR